jgi:hypothetical protein
MKPAGLKLDQVPLQIARLGCPQAISVRDQDLGGVATAVPAAFPRRHQGLNLGACQILARPFNCARRSTRLPGQPAMPGLAQNESRRASRSGPQSYRPR